MKSFTVYHFLREEKGSAQNPYTQLHANPIGTVWAASPEEALFLAKRASPLKNPHLAVAPKHWMES